MTVMGSLSGKEIKDEAPAEVLDMLSDVDFLARLKWLLSQTNQNFNLTGRVINRLISMAERASPTSSANGWRDIASAPKDGSEILVYEPHHGRKIACWISGPGDGEPAWMSDIGELSPVKWHPLPAASERIR